MRLQFTLNRTYTKEMVYWRGAKRIASTKITEILKFTGAKKNKKLQSKDEF